jgi:outer membrane protein assembly factor BamB
MPWLRSLAVLLVVALSAWAEDWPQWLGPRRDGSSAEKVVAWKGPLEIVWRQPVAAGHSSPVVAAGKVYVFTRVQDRDEEQLQAFDAASGKPLWQIAYDRGKFFSPFGTGPQGTPVVAGNRVYTYGATAILTCFDTDGKQLWQVDTLKQFNVGAKEKLQFGAACSPLIEDGKVMVHVAAKAAPIVAFTADKGGVAWKALDDGASYSSPIIIGTAAQRQVVFFTAKGLASLSPKDGSVFWQYPFVDKLLESSTTPVLVGDRLVASAITIGTVALKLRDQGGRPAAKEDWRSAKLTSYFTTPVAVGAEHLYMVTASNPLAFTTPEATLRCIDLASGKEQWKRPGVGKFHAALLRTGNDKLLMMEEDGTLVLIDPSPKAYQELARSKVCGHAWAHPAISGGQLYVRDEKELICVRLPE